MKLAKSLFLGSVAGLAAVAGAQAADLPAKKAARPAAASAGVALPTYASCYRMPGAPTGSRTLG